MEHELKSSLIRNLRERINACERIRGERDFRKYLRGKLCRTRDFKHPVRRMMGMCVGRKISNDVEHLNITDNKLLESVENDDEIHYEHFKKNSREDKKVNKLPKKPRRKD